MSKSESSLIEQHVSEKISNNFSEKPKFVIGVSGGADSMALLFTLKQLDVNAFVVHINYGLRGEDSDKDQELVEGIAFEWGFECCSIKLDSKSANKENFQNWARKERYRVFLELAEEVGAVGIIVAHHKDDQVETILQKVFRGSGPEAWGGMSSWDGNIFRPLLSFSKNEILQYCKERAIPYREDKSNLESKYSRNFLRNEFSEKLNTLFPGWVENILRLQDFGKLNELAIDELVNQYSNHYGLSISSILELDQVLAQAVIKKFLEGYISSLSRGIIQEAYNLTSSQTGARLELSEAFFLIKDRENLIVKKETNSLETVKITKKMLFKGLHSNNLKLIISEEPNAGLYLDVNKLNFPLNLRRWKSGDRIQPLGMGGSQKVSDHLTNRKVSAANKEKSLVLSDTDGTIYAIIFEEKETELGTISEICKVTNSTKQYLLITPKK